MACKCQSPAAPITGSHSINSLQQFGRVGRREKDALLLFVCSLSHSLPRLILSHAFGCCLPLSASSFLLPSTCGPVCLAPGRLNSSLVSLPSWSGLIRRQDYLPVQPGLRGLAAWNPLPPVSCLGNTDSNNPPCLGRT